jgi:hypothetical protein
MHAQKAKKTSAQTKDKPGGGTFSSEKLVLIAGTAVQEIFNNDHRVVSQRGAASGKFTFTAAEAGDHKICFQPSSNSGKSGWLSTSHPNGGVKLSLDLAIGESSAIESSDKGKLEDIAQRVRDLNARLTDVRREQVFQRVCLHFSLKGCEVARAALLTDGS